MKRGQDFFWFGFVIFLFLTSFLLLLAPGKVFALSREDIFQRIRERFSFSRPSPSPTVFPHPTPSLVPQPSIRPFPTPNVRIFRFRFPNSSPSPSPTLNKRDFMMSQINDYRQSQGLSAVEPDYHTCSYAERRAREIASDFSHGGFSSNSLPYPNYSMAVENISLNSNYKEVVPAWINSSGHAQNLRADTPFGCVGWHGNYYAYEGWRP